jgi:hypothetical protein
VTLIHLGYRGLDSTALVAFHVVGADYSRAEFTGVKAKRAASIARDLTPAERAGLGELPATARAGAIRIYRIPRACLGECIANPLYRDDFWIQRAGRLDSDGTQPAELPATWLSWLIQAVMAFDFPNSEDRAAIKRAVGGGVK